MFCKDRRRGRDVIVEDSMCRYVLAMFPGSVGRSFWRKCHGRNYNPDNHLPPKISTGTGKIDMLSGIVRSGQHWGGNQMFIKWGPFQVYRMITLRLRNESLSSQHWGGETPPHLSPQLEPSLAIIPLVTCSNKNWILAQSATNLLSIFFLLNSVIFPLLKKNVKRYAEEKF